MRIIAGTAKGTRLTPPADRAIRPTLDRVREACFSIIGPRLEGARFLDLFAGTGANGLEALSRGAAHADFVESDRAARQIVEENISRTKFGDRAHVHALTLPGGLAKLARSEPYDVIYADPPHKFINYAALFDAIESAQLLAPAGLVILEHASRADLPEGFPGFELKRQAAYGQTSLSFFHPTTQIS
jgi:16S rRNA (guanine(966)-N(2))-methyltransferase RsmD